MERSTSKLWDISWCSDKGIVEPSVKCLSSNSQSELKYVDVDIGVKAIKKKSFKTDPVLLVWTFGSLPL